MRVCLISTEIFRDGLFGGFGALTRKIATGLARKGIDVIVATIKKNDQKPIEIMENFTVINLPVGLYSGFKQYKNLSSIFKVIDADIYHSEEPSLSTFLAKRGDPNKKHIVTFQDPRALSDWKKEWGIARFNWEQIKFFLKYYYIEIGPTVKKLDALFCQAKYVISKAVKIYNLNSKPDFLPNPVDIPTHSICKEAVPTVCFLGRWDPRKRPELFFELAKRFPQVQFIAMGACQPHFAERDKILRQKYGDISNLKMVGWTFGKEKSAILEKSWILINTSTRECLPISYLEAAAHKCAILSHENPDNFASSFGFWAQKGDLENFTEGLKFLLNSSEWKRRGEMGQCYVKETHEYEKVINQHITVYENLLKSK